MRNYYSTGKLAIGLLVFLALPSMTLGQAARGTIVGHVEDATRAAVAGASVTAVNTATGVKNTFVTQSVGDYVFVNLIPGTYVVTVSASGFQTSVSQPMVLQLDQTLRQDFTLGVGAVKQEVTVSAAGQMIQAENATVGEVMEDKYIVQLPLNGRDFTSLVAISGGVTTPSGGIQTSVFYLHGLNPDFSSMSVGGARPASTQYTIDGVNDTDYFFARPTNLPSVDAIQEFKLLNSNYSTQYGFAASQVNVAIKSGTNQLHGSAWDYLQNDALNQDSPLVQAENTQDHTDLPAKSPFKQNQFGGAIGGPVRLPWYNGRDRTFWFANYEGGRLRVGSGPTSMLVPTAKERNGDFSDWPYPIYNPATSGSLPATTSDPAGRAVFAGNAIPTAQMSPIAEKLVPYYPLPNNNCTDIPTCDNYTGEVVSPTTTDVLDARVDHELSVNDRLTYTMAISRDVEGQPTLIPIANSAAYDHNRLFGLEWQHTLSPRAINEFTIGYNYQLYHNGLLTADGPNLTSQIGIQNGATIPAFYGIPWLDLNSDYAELGNSNNGYTELDRIGQIVDNLTFIHEKHTMYVGADVRRAWLSNVWGFSTNGRINFSGAYTASNPNAAIEGGVGPTYGNAMADVLLGDPTTIVAPPPLGSAVAPMDANEVGIYAQDDYRLTPRLTLDFGLRWELPPTLHSTASNGGGTVLDLATPGGGKLWTNQAFVNSIKPINNPSAAAIYYQCCASPHLEPTPLTNFAPRFGFAFRPFASDKTVVRGGYGYFYDNTAMYHYLSATYSENSVSLLQANPNYPVPTGFEQVSPLALNTLWLPPVPLSPTAPVAPRYTQSVGGMWPQNRSPYVQQWTLDVQYALTRSMLLDVGYMGLRGAREPGYYEYNQAFPPTVAGDPCNTSYLDISQVPATSPCLSDPNFQPADTRVPYRNIAPSANSNANLFDSSYNAMQVRLEKRMSQGLTLMANYTWSKSLDDDSEWQTFNGDTNVPANDHDLMADWGPSAYDQTQRMTIDFYYQLPVGKGRRWSLGRANWILGGWGASGIVTFASGVPFSIFPYASGETQFGTAYASDSLRANQICNPGAGFTQTVTEWFNTSCFSAPPLGRFGDEQRNSVRAPGERQSSLAFSKNFPLYHERHQLEFRAELFNFPQSWHTGSIEPANNITEVTYGSLVPLNGLGALNLWNPRIIQLSLRYSF